MPSDPFLALRGFPKIIIDPSCPTRLGCYHERAATLLEQLRMSWPQTKLAVQIAVPVVYESFRSVGPCGYTDHLVGHGSCPECGREFRVLGAMKTVAITQGEAEMEYDKNLCGHKSWRGGK